jgi:hypothetical protein
VFVVIRMFVLWDWRRRCRRPYFWSAVDGPELDESECRVCVHGGSDVCSLGQALVAS